MSGGQLAELGYSEDTIWRDTAAGRLHRLYRDVFGVGHNAVSRHGRALAAVLAAGEGALLSHRSAAWLWGLASYWPRPVEVTAEVPRRSRPALRLHSAQTLLEEDRDLFERVPVTAVPRTLLDFAAAADRYLESALSNAERRGLLDLADLEALIRRSRGFRGVARLRSALEIFQDPDSPGPASSAAFWRW